MLQKALNVAKSRLREGLVPLVYRYPPTGLQPERLGVYLHALLERADRQGDVAEIGCNLGGTSVLAFKCLKRAGWTGRYICYDTFGGFVKEQFEADVPKGTSRSLQGMFAANSERLVRKILDFHGCQDVSLVPGDIVSLPEKYFSPGYIAVLLDIDLSEPTYAALNRIWPRMLPGGIILVDDCPENYSWKAREGYERFCRENELRPEYIHGLGVLRRQPGSPKLGDEGGAAVRGDALCESPSRTSG